MDCRGTRWSRTVTTRSQRVVTWGCSQGTSQPGWSLAVELTIWGPGSRFPWGVRACARHLPGSQDMQEQQSRGFLHPASWGQSGVDHGRRGTSLTQTRCSGGLGCRPERQAGFH